MPLPPASVSLTESDYETIEAAVMETARGRWFLAEYAQRNRNADTKLVLEAIQKLQRSVLGAETAPAVAAPEKPYLRADFGEMQKVIERTKLELAGIHAARQRDGDLGAELQHIIEATGQAIAEVLADSERINEISQTMRFQNFDANICDQLDGLATHIYTACAFQDLTGQRIGKVGTALKLLEERIVSLVKVWQADSENETATSPSKDALLNGPAREGEGLMQDQVDELLAIDKNHDVFWTEENAPSSVPEAPAAPKSSAASGSDIEKLSTEERLALFS